MPYLNVTTPASLGDTVAAMACACAAIWRRYRAARRDLRAGRRAAAERRRAWPADAMLAQQPEPLPGATPRGRAAASLRSGASRAAVLLAAAVALVAVLAVITDVADAWSVLQLSPEAALRVANVLTVGRP